MRVLVTTPAGGSNSYVDDCLRDIGQQATIERGVRGFWNPRPDIDLVHIQWPEQLIGWAVPQGSDFERLERTLEAWRSHCPLVVTRHNRRPHAAADDDHPLARWAARCQSAADAVVHLGNASRNDPGPGWRPDAEHALIRHPIPRPRLASLGKREARRILGLGEAKVALIPGMLRNHRERTAITRLAVRHGWQVLAPLFNGNGAPPWRSDPVLRLTWLVDRARARHCRCLQPGTGPVGGAVLALCARAADAALIPRMGALNSGIAYFAAAYGLPVAGPAEGVHGEDLAAWGQPRFDGLNSASMAAALTQARWPPGPGAAHSCRVVAEQHLALWRRIRARFAAPAG